MNLFRLHLLAVLACAFVITPVFTNPAAASTKHARIVNGIPGPKIVNGIPNHHPTVAALLYETVIRVNGPGEHDDDTITTARCSGTLISCDTVLTAKHCIDGSSGQGSYALPHSVFFQHAGVIPIAELIPELDPGAGTQPDAAIIKLAVPVTGISPTPLPTAAMPAGSVGTIVGYGRTGGPAHTNVDTGVKRQGKVVIEASCPSFLPDEMICWRFTSPIGEPGEDSNTCEGDSGGPLFWNDGTGEVVAGVTSGGDNGQCLSNDESWNVDVFAVRDLILAAAGDLGSDKCGEISQVGDGQTEVQSFTAALSASNTDDTYEFEVSPGTETVRFGLNGVQWQYFQNHNYVDYVDFDLFVTTPDGDQCSDITNGQPSFCEFSNPTPGTYSARVHRYRGDGEYQLNASIFGPGCSAEMEGQPCNDGNACTVGDTCQAGVCTGSVLPDGTSCNDGAACTSADVCTAGVCGGEVAPYQGCFLPTKSKGASVTFKNHSNPDKSQFIWTWKKGEATAWEDFGDPMVDSGYDLCVYGELNGKTTILTEARIPANGNWKQTRSSFNYKDDSLSAAGLHKAMLKPGKSGKSSISLKGKGEDVPMPILPRDKNETMTIQLISDTACFSSTFSEAKKNKSDLFKAKSD